MLFWRYTIKILSLFDGISCGQAALLRAGISINEYAAFEIDKYAMAISRFNFPETKFYGDVTKADFSMFASFDMLIGGSPCNFWSCARGNKREVDKSGLGWHLFSQFILALNTIRPRWFLYENVASMPANIMNFISEEFGSNPIMINSALLSAQQRKRYYWTNIPNIEQPKDKGILLQDILESGLPVTDKAYCITANYGGAEIRNTLERKQRSMIFEFTDEAFYEDNSGQFIMPNVRVGISAPVRLAVFGNGSQGQRIYSVHGKTICLNTSTNGLYKVDLPDGDYIIRKLTPIEAERCQTLPDGYTSFGTDENGNSIKISNTQRYKCIGNGWTIDVIAHMLSFIPK